VPYIAAAGELKTKPTQHSVQKLREIGIQPDILLCRTEHQLTKEVKKKIALFCNVAADAVFEARDVSCIYELPMRFYAEGVDDKVAELLNIWSRAPRLDKWEKLVEVIQSPQHSVTVGIVGKYVHLIESYKSLNEALVHGGVANHARVILKHIDSEQIDAQSCAEKLAGLDGILVPGGFGHRGIEGKICAIHHAREKGVPFFGICLGMQMAVVEFARYQAGLQDASSTEFNPETSHPVIHLMEEQRGIDQKGGTMRLGAYPCRLREGTQAAAIYRTQEISERHRHRFEFNNAFRETLEAKGMVLSGLSPDGNLVEMIELPASQHPYFVACQFHPEFKSRPTAPHPLFSAFIRAALAHQQHSRA
jgi:CTP synthase